MADKFPSPELITRYTECETHRERVGLFQDHPELHTVFRKSHVELLAYEEDKSLATQLAAKQKAAASAEPAKSSLPV